MTFAPASLPAEDLRELFALRPGVVFLNHGSYGACPRPVMETYQAWQWDIEGQPVEFVERRLNTLLAAARGRLGSFLGASADDLLYVGNATTGLGIMTRLLPLEPGDEIMTTDHEYHAMEATWNRFCSVRGTRYVHQHVPLPVGSAEEIVEAVWAGVTPRTRVLFFSHISSMTALTMPMERLVARAREHGILTIVDGAHAPGQRDLSLEQAGVDAYIGTCHKWMMAPRGSGFMYVRREAQPLLWGEPRLTPGATYTHNLAELQWQGTRDLAAYLAVPAAIRFMDEHDWPTQQARCHKLVQHARECVAALTGLPQPVPDSPDWYAQMAILPIPRCDGGQLRTKLYERYQIEVPVTSYGEQQYVRVSAQAYNTRADIDTLIQGLTALLPEAIQAAEKK